MRLPRAFPVLLFLLLGLWGAGAQTVELLAAQNGAEEVSPETELILSGCMDSFFAAGLIATNSRPVQMSLEAYKEASLGVAEAKDGFADYLVVLYVTYLPAQGIPGGQWPSEIAYRIVRVRDQGLVTSGIQKSRRPESAMDQKKFEAALRGLGGDLGAAISAAIGAALGRKIGRIDAPSSRPLGQGV